MPTDVTQAGILVQDQTANANVTQAGVIVQDQSANANVTQAGVIIYESSANIDVTQAGVIVFEQPEEVTVTQAGVLQFIEGLHRNPELSIASLEATSAVLQVRNIYDEWNQLQYEVIRNSDSAIIFTATRVPADSNFGSITLTGLTTGETYTGKVRARSSAGYTPYATIEFVPVALVLPGGGNIFSFPGYGEPVSTLGDRTNLTSILFCWESLVFSGGQIIEVGDAIELTIIDPFTLDETLLADEAALVGLNCIHRSLVGFDDGWYIARLVTRDSFGVERTWYHAGFAIDTAEAVLYLDQAPVNLSDWTFLDGINLPWLIEFEQEPTCANKLPNVLSRKLRQRGDPTNFVNGPTVIGPVFPTLFERGRAASTTSIWVGAAPFGFFFGGEQSEVSVFSAVGHGLNIKAYFGHALLGPRGFGDNTGITFPAAEFGLQITIPSAGFEETFRSNHTATVSHPCLFNNNNPTKWPLYLMVEHEVTDVVNGIIHIRGMLGAPYNIVVDEIVDTGVDLTTITCSSLGVGRFKIDNFQNDNGWGQFDNFHFLGIPGTCPPPEECPDCDIPDCPPDDPDCNPIPEPEPEPEPEPVELCPPTIFNIENANIIIFASATKCPGDVVMFFDDDARPIVHINPCPLPITPPPIIRVGETNLVLPMFTLQAEGNASTAAFFGEANLILPMLTLEAEGEVLLEGDMEADVPLLEGEGEGSVATVIDGEANLTLPMLTLQAEGSVADISSEAAGGYGGYNYGEDVY
jgi:hypothetical protein